MPRLTRIYTRTGDAGDTALGGGVRVPKDHPRLEACGTVDELASALGAARATGLVPELAALVATLQNDLFHLGADLCFREAEKKRRRLPHIAARHVRALEKKVDALLKPLGFLDNFILPGGSPGAAQLHVARGLCRRAERRVTALARGEGVGRHVIPYLNRLGDLLFVMARYENFKRGIPETLWQSRI